MKKNKYALKLSGLLSEDDMSGGDGQRQTARAHDWQVLTAAHDRLKDPKIRETFMKFLNEVIGPLISR